MYDITNLDTFEKLTNWLKDIEEVSDSTKFAMALGWVVKKDDVHRCDVSFPMCMSYISVYITLYAIKCRENAE